MLSYKHAYLLGSLFVCFPVWLTLLLRRKDLRKEILLTSIIGGFFGPISQLIFTKDYWRPELIFGGSIGIEDFIFGFCIAGISASIYEELFGKKFTKRELRNTNWYHNFMLLVTATVSTFLLLSLGTDLNSIYASIIAFLVGTAIIFFRRKDLAADILVSGLFLSFFGFISYMILLSIYPNLITKWWLMDNISGILILGVPIEELMWGFAGGMFIGPFYEFTAGLKFRK